VPGTDLACSWCRAYVACCHVTLYNSTTTADPRDLSARLPLRSLPHAPLAGAFGPSPIAMAASLRAAAGAATRTPLVIDIAADEGAADPWYAMSAAEEAAFLARGSAGAAEASDAEEDGSDTGEKAVVVLHEALTFTSGVVSRCVRFLSLCSTNAGEPG